MGYYDGQVAWHLAKLAGIIGISGAIVGVALGDFLGVAMLDLYADFLDLPGLAFNMRGSSVVTAVGVSMAALAAGGLGSVLRIMRLQPAEAMRPASPARYHRSWLDALAPSHASQMVVREIARRPVRSALSTIAIAASVGLMVVGGWYYDGIDIMIYSQFHEVMREDVSVSFSRPRPERAIRELAHLPGVQQAEGLRMVPVRFVAKHVERQGTITGYPDDGEMRALRDKSGRLVPLPPSGIVLTDMLAELLGIEVGDTLRVEVTDGARQVQHFVVSGLVDEAFGLQGHMRLSVLRDALLEPKVVSLALLQTDPVHAEALDKALAERPYVTSVSRRQTIFQRFRDQSGNMIITMATLISLFAAAITVGVVYNNARVSLSARSRDLASMRVLGFSRREVASILLGELAIVVVLALPLGLFIGKMFVLGLASMMDPETYRLLIVLTARTYAFAATIATAAALVSALAVRRKLDRLDPIVALKTRE